MDEYRIRRAIAIVPLLMGLAALGYAGHSTYESKQFLAGLKQAIATVGGPAGRTTGGSRSAPVDLLAIRYIDASGREATGSIGANEGYKTGDRVPILYDPANPGFAMLPKYVSFYEQGALIFWAAGTLCILVAIGWFVFGTMRMRSKAKSR